MPVSGKGAFCIVLRLTGLVSIMNENNEVKEKLGRSDKSVDKKRRSFAKGGIAAPVILTLASQPAFGLPCLSNIMSGNLSDPDRGDCVLGNSPGGWGQPRGRLRSGVLTITTPMPTAGTNVYVWPAPPGFVYGSLVGINKGGNGNQCSDYSGGTLYSVAFDGAGPLVGPDKPMREFLCGGVGSDDSHLVAAILNAFHYPNYILTVQQVKDLQDGTLSYPPGFGSLGDFLDSTW